MIETEIRVTPEIAAEHGLSAEEYARIQKILKREPSYTELGIFSVMWSEHCSYKSSKVHLKRLPTRGARVVQGPGENAGVVEIGDGWVAAFKIESHNHPSFVEPFQGAATGVGGILRDIFTMGARPIAVMDSLRFGEIAPSGAKAPNEETAGNVAAEAATHKAEILRSSAAGGLAQDDKRDAGLKPGGTEEMARNRRILDGVIGGIAFYGNCFGVPTVGGEVQFEPCYAGNPLVNVLALGIARREELFFARARGVGNPVIYVGAKTGRDGIHGASLLASAEFSEESQHKRPNVQVGDPFMEKLLLEACLEAMQTGAVVAIQDMGAAGLTCSTCEMGSRGGTGIEIELAAVPQRETGMTPYEIMLSESQERMLLVAERGREAEVLGVFAKWGLDAMVIGKVTGDGMLRVRQHGTIVAEIPAHPLAEEGPVYSRPMKAPGARRDERLVRFIEEERKGGRADGEDAGLKPGATQNLTENFKAVLESGAVASKRWIYEQYDHMVRTNTLVAPGAGDAAVMRVKGTPRALALSTDSNGRWCWLNPREGAKAAVAEAARNVACTGARPIAATNCLNFGNPEKPEIMWQFSETIDGMAEACSALDTPITGGNVSFYNETLGKPVYPTPTMGVLGVVEDASKALGMGFKEEGDAIVLLDGRGGPMGPPAGKGAHTGASLQMEFSSSEYAKRIHGIVAGEPPAVDLAAERRLIEALVKLASAGAIRSAHDVSDGGIAVTIAECCFAGHEAASGAEAPSKREGENVTAKAVTHNAAELGATIRLESSEPVEYALFGERGARAVVTCAPRLLARVTAIARECGVGAREIGSVSRGEFRIEYNGGAVIRDDIAALKDIWANALIRTLKG